MTALKCARADNTTGVFFASFEHNDHAIVIKSTPEPMKNLMGFLMIDVLTSVRAPACKVLNASDPEFKKMQFAMDKLALGNEDLKK